MKRLMAVVTAVMMLAGCAGAAADADGQAYAIKPLQTFDSRVKLRDQPSRGGSILGQYYAGTPVTVFSEQDGWAQVRVGSQDGYMMSEFLQAGDSAAPTMGYIQFPEQDGCVTFTALDGTVLPRLAQGDVLVLGTVGDTLLHVATDAFGDRLDGYVPSWRVSWTENLSTLTVTADDPSRLINLREEPSMDASVRARIFPGAIGCRLFDSHTAEDGWTFICFDGAAGYIRDDFLSSSDGAAYVPPTAQLKNETAIVTACSFWGSISQSDPLWILGVAGSKATPLYLCRVGGWRSENDYCYTSCCLQQSEVNPFVLESISTTGYTTAATSLYDGNLAPFLSLPAGTRVTIRGGCDAQGEPITFYGSYLCQDAVYLRVEAHGSDGIGMMGYVPVDAVDFDRRLMLPGQWTNG